MNVKRTAYVLMALAKGHHTLDELVAATTLPKPAITRVLRDHAKKLSVKIATFGNGEEVQYCLEHWGMLDTNWLWPREREIADELGLPHLETHARNTRT